MYNGHTVSMTKCLQTSTLVQRFGIHKKAKETKVGLPTFKVQANRPLFLRKKEEVFIEVIMGYGEWLKIRFTVNLF